MSEQSAKPYLVRAICEWCADNGLTPYLAVKVDARTRVPLAYVKNGEIVLNVSAGATRRLTIDNEYVQFTARFSGVSQEVTVPMSQVAGIFAKETGYGFAFVVAAGKESEDATKGVAAPVAAVAAEIANNVASGPDGEPSKADKRVPDGARRDEKPKARPSHLSIIK